MADQNQSNPKLLFLAGIEFLPDPYNDGHPPFKELFVTINNKGYSVGYAEETLRFNDPYPIPIEPDQFTIWLKYNYERGDNELVLSCIENADGTLSLKQDGKELPAHSVHDPGSLVTVNFTYANRDGIVIIGTVDTVTED